MVAAPRRPSMTTKRKMLIFAQHKGICYLCKGKISVGEAWDAEHVIPWEISRDDSDENLRPAHVKCHRVKTARDRKDIAKVHRIEARHKGAKTSRGRPMPGSKASGIKKRMDGTVERRGTLWPAGRAEDFD